MILAVFVLVASTLQNLYRLHGTYGQATCCEVSFKIAQKNDEHVPL